MDAMVRAMLRIRGSYALELMFQDYPGEIFAARKDSPMIIGVADGETYVASDVPAILKYTRNVYYIGNQEIAHLTKGTATFYNIEQEEIQKELTEIKWDAAATEKGRLRALYAQGNPRTAQGDSGYHSCGCQGRRDSL